MRIAQIDLTAFGHFSKRRLVLDGGSDLHMVYGPNEAGKTTLSRALRAAFFGVPERSGDGHLHGNAALRVGLVLEAASGERLAVMRRKARKNSLVRYDPLTAQELGETVDEALLSSAMGGLSEGLYAAMFGLDHDELVAGGRALAEGKGEVGQSLFEAGAGLSGIRQLRGQLAKEAEELFRPRASSSAIFREIEQYNAARKEAREAQTRPAEWDHLNKSASDAQAGYEQARARQEALQREARRLERLAAVLPDVAARALAWQRLSQLGPVTRLSASAAAQRIAAQTSWRQAELAGTQALEKLARHQGELESITLPEALLQEGGALEALYYALASYRSARNECTSASTRIEQANARATPLLAALGQVPGGDQRDLIPSVTLRARVQGLAARGAALQIEHQAAARLNLSCERECHSLAAELAELGALQVPAALLDAVQFFETHGNPQVRAQALSQELATLQAALVREAGALTCDSLASVLATGTPLPAELARFRVERDALEQRKQALKTRIEHLQDDMAVVHGELEGLLQSGDLATAGQLTAQRRLREGLWHQIRDQALAATPGPRVPLAEPMAAQYELAVQVADATADSRFTDAARVSMHADLLKRLAQMRHALELEQVRLGTADQDTSELKGRWQVFLAKYQLPALGVPELGDWLNQRELFLQRHHTFCDIQAQALAASAQAQTTRRDLAAALLQAQLPTCAAQETLAQAITRARAFLEKASNAASSHRILSKKHMSAQERRADAARDLAHGEQLMQDWRRQWGQAMAAIRLSGAALGEEATARLAQLDALEQALDTLTSARAQLTGAQAVLTAVDLEVNRLCLACAYERASRPADAVIETLYEQLCAARAQAQRAATLQDLIADAAQTGERARQALASAQAELDTLIRAAQCETLDELIMAEDLSAEHRSLQSQVEAIEARLVLASALTLQDVLTQAAGQDLALVQVQLDQISEDLATCTADVQTLHQVQLQTQQALGRVDGAALAAQAEQRAAEAAARMGNLVADYAAARLASGILVEAMATYQQRFQGPLLVRASELFATITGGRFVKVSTDFDEELTILVAVRPNGQKETVHHLSSGTRDQLFLALRLAAIESHLQTREAVPVVVDDIVINFDDGSADATFAVLAGLARKTQVLFLTHHEHLLARAVSAIGSDAFTAHHL